MTQRHPRFLRRQNRIYAETCGRPLRWCVYGRILSTINAAAPDSSSSAWGDGVVFGCTAIDVSPGELRFASIDSRGSIRLPTICPEQTTVTMQVSTPSTLSAGRRPYHRGDVLGRHPFRNARFLVENVLDPENTYEPRPPQESASSAQRASVTSSLHHVVPFVEPPSLRAQATSIGNPRDLSHRRMSSRPGARGAHRP